MNQELWRKVEDLFHAALERAPAAGQSFLDSACDGDAALRRQVELRFHAFRSKPNILRKEGGCTTELDYTEQYAPPPATVSATSSAAKSPPSTN